MFNERLREIRKSKNMTQKAVAASINFAERNYQELEYGHCKPSFDTLIALADCFNVSLDYLVGRTDDPVLHKNQKNRTNTVLFFIKETEGNYHAYNKRTKRYS